MADGAQLTTTLGRERWTQLIAGVLCMIMIANLQYGWTLFVHPISAAHGWSVASIQIAFSIFVALETWLTPIEGWIVDRLGAQRGPKLMVAFGGIMIAAGWIVNSKADTLSMLYLGAVLVRHRRRRGLRDGRWAGGEVVPRPPRARRRLDRRRLRRRRRPHGGSDPLCDRLQRLPDRVLLVRSRARRRRASCWHGCCARRKPMKSPPCRAWRRPK